MKDNLTTTANFKIVKGKDKKKYGVITLSAIMYGLGIGLFLNPNQLAPGGISGIAIILKEVFPMLPGVGVLIIIINVPIMILGAWKFGKKFILSKSSVTDE